MKLTVTRAPLDGVILIDPEFSPDGRGFFYETWNARDFSAAGLELLFVQDSHSQSERGVLRGLHYQDMSAPLGKLVRCSVGVIFDVAVDLRISSPTFGQWFGAELSAENKRQLWLPVGFAHGFQAIAETVEVQYKQTGYYTPQAEGTLAWNDPQLAIAWPIDTPTLSARDRCGMSLEQYRRNPVFR